MWIKDIDFPELLLKAQRSGTLVIFAGAGVSVGPPSNYPNFSDLADQIAGEVLHRKKEPIDHFLGQLANKKVEVHKQAREILNDPKSQPNPLHSALLRLFSSAADVRLVTTNFDTHFTTAAREVFKGSELPEIFRAPALPLGHEFTGIVYLHGCVDQQPGRLVLTDSDFGRAYLTEGWARRCIQALFSTYTVLFVGYSHNDTVMNYLARGLPPNAPGRRFALTPESDPSHWDFLNIVPVPYPLKRSTKHKSNKHRALSDSLHEWVNRSQWGALEHEKRIRDIVTVPPPRDKESIDYIDSVFTELSTTRFFVSHAKTVEWLRWAENKPAFQSLFQSGSQVDLLLQELARWVAANFICSHPDDCFSLIQRQGQQLNPVLWEAIAWILSLDDSTVTPNTLIRWVVLLLRTVPQYRPNSDRLDSILRKCRHPEESIAALLLFEFLARPRLDLHKGFHFHEAHEPEGVDVEICLEGDAFGLTEAWEEFFRPRLQEFAERLEPIVTHHLQHAHLLLCAMGKADDLWDPLSYGRSAIEPHGQDRYRRHRGIHILIDAARDVLEWIVRVHPSRAHAVLEAWSQAASPLLKRLAIHGVTESSFLSPDEKLAWIRQRNWFYTFGFKHEVFRLLKIAYPKASDTARIELLEQVARGPVASDAETLGENTRQYEIYNLFFWLHHVAPGCSLAEKRFVAMQKAQPQFSPREFPDFDHWMSTGTGRRVQPAVTVEELLQRDPETDIEWFLFHRGEDPLMHLEGERSGFLNIVTAAVTQNFPWTWRLVTALQKKADWASDLWESLFRGWQEGTLTEHQWAEVLTFMGDNPQLHGVFTPAIANLLERCTSREQHKLPASCVMLAQRVAEQLWDTYRKAQEQESLTAERDLLGRAINHPAGKLVLFWLNVLSRQRAEAGDNGTEIPQEAKVFFGKVLTETTLAAVLGRVVLASQLYFLFSLEAEWARQCILPLLNWSKDKDRARQAWHGFLIWGRWDDRLLSDLMPLYEQTFPHVTTDLSEHRERVSEHVAAIAVGGTQDPLHQGWLRNFLTAVDRQDRIAWAGHIRHQLRSVPSEAAQSLWKRWMKRYWHQRTMGVPWPLEPDELEKMLGWAISLKSVFPEVVDSICKSSAPPLQYTSLYRELQKGDFATTYAEDVTRLLLHLLPKASQPFQHCHELEQIFLSLANSSVSSPALLDICQELALLGCNKAGELEQLVLKKRVPPVAMLDVRR